MKRYYKKENMRRFRTGGFTILEVVISITITGMILAAVISLQYLSTRTIQDMYGPMRARSVRMNALNQIRFRLCDAKIGSCVVSDSNHRIRFEDPNLAVGGNAITSEFYFDTNSKTLYFKENVDTSEPWAVAKGPINITFTPGSRFLDPPNYQVYNGTEAVVTVFVQTSAELAYSNVDIRDGETVIYLRNL
ncbi:type II secretion system protein [Candidatus Sumerlaeota bacterium]|nr:type II secretion system protein [Candidatus Sumerlaeota bacterium]